jgi:hypothetical protein
MEKPSQMVSASRHQKDDFSASQSLLKEWAERIAPAFLARFISF